MKIASVISFVKGQRIHFMQKSKNNISRTVLNWKLKRPACRPKKDGWSSGTRL